MIRLTLNAQSQPEFHLFNKSTILLGSDSTLVDLVLPGCEIQPIHLKIIEQNGFLILLNEGNDPFASVNGHPFGKKLLNSGDVILVDQTTILFENLDSAPPSPLENALNAEELASLLENKLKIQEINVLQNASPHPSPEVDCFSSFLLPFEKEVEALKDEEFRTEDLNQVLKEIGVTQDVVAATAALSTISIDKKQTSSLKDDYLSEFEDNDHPSRAGVMEKEKQHNHPYFRSRKWILFFIFAIALIAGIGTPIFFLSVSDKSEAQETKATQGVADVAMALLHAKLHHLKPHNQNWSDVDFLKNNLQSILPETHSYASQIDSQGQFNCCPYTLRIYTNADLSHFLLIAQPAPHLLYWLIPQSMIVVDSHLMELRTLKDVRSLNRLLANPDPLDGMNGKEILNLIKQGGLIPLTSLSAHGNVDFIPPKNLAWILPGAENLIYNAPRYYRLGQNIVHHAINLSTSKGSSQEVAILKQEVENFTSLNHYILYSDQGKKSAVLSHQGISLFAPSDNLLFGYVLFNAQGKIHQVHLLREEEEQSESLQASSKEIDSPLIAYQPTVEASSHEEQKKEVEENPLIDRNHPIYIQLHSLVISRENELKPLIAALFTLVNQELITPRAQFQVEYQNLSHTYLMANAKHKKDLKEKIEALYREYSNIPIHQFFAYIQELHLEQLIQHDEEQSLQVIDENCQQNMEALSTHIENSKSLAELNNIIHIAASWLNFDYIKDPQELIKYQNLLRNQLLEQLERCLLTQKTQITVKEEDREILQDILNQERLIQPEERDFFLDEFDSQYRAVQHFPED